MVLGVSGSYGPTVWFLQHAGIVYRFYIDCCCIMRSLVVGGILLMVFELDLASVKRDVTFRGCLRAKTGFEFANLSCVVWSLKFLSSKEIVFITFL